MNSDTFDAHEKGVKELQNKLRYVEGASGHDVAIGGKILAVDLFDKPGTCRKVWERLKGVFFTDNPAFRGGAGIPRRSA